MLKDLLDLFRELASERSKTRDKTITFLEQVLSELVALSSLWNKIATMVEKGDILDLFRELASERSKTRDKTITFLEQVLSELVALSSLWNKIATMVEKGDIPKSTVREALREQRSHYDGIVSFRDEISRGILVQHEHATRIIRILDSVVGEKSNLYFQIGRAS